MPRRLARTARTCANRRRPRSRLIDLLLTRQLSDAMLRTIRNARARVLVYIKLRDEKKKTKQKRKYCKIWVSKKQKINAFSGGCLLCTAHFQTLCGAWRPGNTCWKPRRREEKSSRSPRPSPPRREGVENSVREVIP
jgi:hypothetical protein